MDNLILIELVALQRSCFTESHLIGEMKARIKFCTEQINEFAQNAYPSLGGIGSTSSSEASVPRYSMSEYIGELDNESPWRGWQGNRSDTDGFGEATAGENVK